MADSDAAPSVGGQSSEMPTHAPRQDKLESLAARTKEHGVTATSTTTEASATAPQQRRGGKLASMAALQQRNEETVTFNTAGNNQAQQDETTMESQTEASLLTRRTQRDETFRDLEQAQVWTWQLLLLAENTARELSHVENMDETAIQETSRRYLETLQNIHDTLTPHAELVVAYQNHRSDSAAFSSTGEMTTAASTTMPSDIAQDEKAASNASPLRSKDMYAARVEMRLAEERRDVLQELLSLEQQEDEGSHTTLADSMNDAAVAATSADAPVDEHDSKEEESLARTTTNKRKRVR